MDIMSQLGHTTLQMTSRYTHAMPENLRTAVDTLGQTKLGRVVRFKRKSEAGSSDPSATADGTNLITREANVSQAKAFALRAHCGRDARDPSEAEPPGSKISELAARSASKSRQVATGTDGR
jgi:hypothetical protein